MMRLQLFRDRTPAFWVALAASAAMLVADIAYLALDGGDTVTFSWFNFCMILAGALCFAVPTVFDFPSAAVLTVGLASFGTASLLAMSLESLSDIWNGVNFVGGNAVMSAVFAGIFLACVLTVAVTCFFPQTKTEG